MAKKILLVSRCAWTLYNFRSGLITALKGRGEAVLGGGSGGDGFEEKVQSLGIPFVPLPVDRRGINPVADLRLLRSLYAWYKRERPDIVHHFTIKPVIYGSLAAHWAGVPRIVNTVTGLGHVFQEEGRAWLRYLVEKLYRAALSRAHHTFFQNQSDRDLFLSRGLAEASKTSLIPGSGLDCSRFAPAGNAPSESENSATILMISRLIREKGIVEYTEAARRVKARFPKAQFQILGTRDVRNPSVVDRETLDRWLSEGIITHLGEVEDVRPAIAAADIVVLPSYREGTPRSLLEAAAMEKPLITTDVPGCREVVSDGQNGLLVPVRDAGALADAMIYLISHPEVRIRMGAAGRKIVTERFSEQIVLEKIFKIYYIG
jgi:glycosyltransferase involved in cell wall biosynthesis